MKLFCKVILFFIPLLLISQENNYQDIIKEFKKNNFREVVNICQKKIKESPDDHKLYGFLSFAYYSLAQQKSVEIDREALQIRGIKKGQSYLFKDNESIKDFTKVKITFNPDTLKLSEQAMLKALSLQKNNLDYLVSLGEIYFSQNEHSKLVNFVDSLTKIFPPKPTANALNRFGIAYFNQKEYEKALDIYKILISRYDNYINAYSDAGACYIMLGKPEEAINILKQAIKIKPNDSTTLDYLYQANVLLLKNDIAAYYKSFLYEKDTSNINTIRDLAFLYYAFDKESSEEFFEKYISLAENLENEKNIVQLAKEILDDMKKGKDDNLVTLMRSEKLTNYGLYNYSLNLLSKVIENDNSNSPAFFDLAMIYRDINMYDLSLKYLSICEELTQNLTKPKDILTIVYKEKTKTYLLLKDYDNAIKYAKLNIDKFNYNTGEIRYLLGLSYLKKGDRLLAKEEFNQVLKINDNKLTTELAKSELELLK
ncbi:MAG TPA: tetratricopeptide repeat protein [Ignavibacteria bacterium]